MTERQQVMKTRRLGRGLESLIRTSEPGVPESGEPAHEPEVDLVSEPGQTHAVMQEIPVDAISPNPYQARRQWNQDKIAELAGSIRANGLVQPVLVRQVEGGYQLIAGERRLRACKSLGMQSVPAIVRRSTDLQQVEWSLVENIHRDDLNPLDRARAYQAYLSQFGVTQAEAAARLGEDKSVISNHLRLLDLPAEIQQMLLDGKLTMGHARAIVSLPTDELRRKIGNRAIAGRLSVREVERIVRRYMNETGTVAQGLAEKKPHVVDMELRIATALGAKVRLDIRRDGKRGRMIIEFHSLEDFDRILDRLGIPGEEQV